MLLWDRDPRAYCYYLEVSIDQKDWVRIIDHEKYLCRSWQYLYFEPRVALYIRIVGTHNTVNKVSLYRVDITSVHINEFCFFFFFKVFHVVSFEAYYTNHTEKLYKGFVVPTQNVATSERSACVTEGVCRYFYFLYLYFSKSGNSLILYFISPDLVEMAICRGVLARQK